MRQRRLTPPYGERNKARPCMCGCKQTVTGKAVFASAACRKRYSREQAEKRKTIAEKATDQKPDSPATDNAAGEETKETPSK